MMSPAQDAPNGISKTTTNAPSNRRIIGQGGPQLPAMSACRGRPQRCTHMHEHSNVVKFAHLWAATFLDGSAYYPIFILKLKSQPELSRMYLSMNWNIQFLQQTKRNSLFCPTHVCPQHMTPLARLLRHTVYTVAGRQKVVSMYMEQNLLSLSFHIPQGLQTRIFTAITRCYKLNEDLRNGSSPQGSHMMCLHR